MARVDVIRVDDARRQHDKAAIKAAEDRAAQKARMAAAGG